MGKRPERRLRTCRRATTSTSEGALVKETRITRRRDWLNCYRPGSGQAPGTLVRAFSARDIEACKLLRIERIVGLNLGAAAALLPHSRTCSDQCNSGADVLPSSTWTNSRQHCIETHVVARRVSVARVRTQTSEPVENTDHAEFDSDKHDTGVHHRVPRAHVDGGVLRAVSLLGPANIGNALAVTALLDHSHREECPRTLDPLAGDLAQEFRFRRFDAEVSRLQLDVPELSRVPALHRAI